MSKRTSTSDFGVSKRQGHDSSPFYKLNLMQGLIREGAIITAKEAHYNLENIESWADRVYCKSSERMTEIPDNSVALAMHSPPYAVGKQYDENLTLEEYLGLIERVSREVYRVLIPGGRYVINIANVGRKPYLSLVSFFYNLHLELDFLPMGEIIWQKAKGASGSCAWGSWMSAKAPRLRDLHEYLLVFAKQSFSRFDRGESDISKDEFKEATLSIWNIPPESARRIGHPAPYPVELASRVIKLFTYKGDVVLDPFNGSGTTCAAAKMLGRHYVGYDISEEYCQLAERRLESLNEVGSAQEK